MKFHNISTLKNCTLYKMMKDADKWMVLYDVALADSYSRGEDLGKLDEEKILSRLRNFDMINSIIIADKITGEMIMELKGLKPGKEVGLIKEKTIAFCLNHPNVTDERIKKYILDYKI